MRKDRARRRSVERAASVRDRPEGGHGELAMEQYVARRIAAGVQSQEFSKLMNTFVAILGEASTPALAGGA